MDLPNVQHAALHECAHAVALAVRTGILTESIYVGCMPDGSCAAGINANSKIPLQAGSLADWIVYNLAGHAADQKFDPEAANRDGAIRDDIVAEKMFRGGLPAVWNAELVSRIKQETAQLVQDYWACIEEMATALLGETPQDVSVLGTNRHVYRLDAIKIEKVLTAHGIPTLRRFPGGYADEQFTKLLERHTLNMQIIQVSHLLATESYNYRRFAEAKRLNTLEFLDYQTWINHYGSAKVEVVEN